jgi:glycosyltransferase involved in cell wall biosynthesis
MRIGIDACCWSNRRGFGRYTRELITHLVAGYPQHEFILVVDRATAEQASFPPGARVVTVDTREQPTKAAAADGSRSLRDMWKLSQAVGRERPDVFFFPAVYSYFPLWKRIPNAVVFHDAIAENHPGLIFPSFRSRLFWRIKTWLAARQATRIVTVSANARAQVAAAFGCPEASIAVISEGPNASFRRLANPADYESILEHYQLSADGLILYVGGISPHKNLTTLLHALDWLRRQSDIPWRLALVGDYSKDSFHSCYREIEALGRQLGLDNRIRFLGFVPDEHLVQLYNAATLLVLPSVSEGFGLPVVEAMACGLPVAASRGGSLPEVVGPAGLLFDPHSQEEMAAAILRLLQQPDLRSRLRAAGLKRVQQYSWKSAAASAMHLFEELGHVRRQAA